MDKFSKIEKEKAPEKKDTSKYANDEFSVLTYNENDIISSKDTMVILPYLKDDGFILMNYQKAPAFSYRYKDNSTYKNEQFFISCIKGQINPDDNDVQNVRRIMYDSTGLVLSVNASIEVDKIVFKHDTNSGQYHFCLLNLSYNDYKQTTLKNPDLQKTIKVSLGDLDEIKCYDLATEYMILKFKYETNI
jgi:hypothetical protein